MMQAALLAAVVAAGSMQAAEPAGASGAFRQLLDEDWEARLREDPLLATATGDHRYDDRLPSVAPADLERAAPAAPRALLGAPAGASTAHQPRPTQDRISYDMFARELRDDVADYELGPVADAHQRRQRLPHRLRQPARATRRSRPRATTRTTSRACARSPPTSPQQIANMREGLRTGFTLPRVVLDGYDVTIRTHVVDDPEKSVFWEPFARVPARRARERARAPARGRPRRGHWRASIAGYRAFLEFMTDEYLPKARTTHRGRRTCRAGREYYAYRVRHFTTLDLTPERGPRRSASREVARIRAEMEDVIRQAGFQGDFAAFLQFLRTDPRFYAQDAGGAAEAGLLHRQADGRQAARRSSAACRACPTAWSRCPPTSRRSTPAGRYVGAPVGGTRAGHVLGQHLRAREPARSTRSRR